MRSIQMQRLHRGWSQAELARRAGIHSSTVSLVESGRLRPYPVQLAKIAEALALPELERRQLFEEAGLDAA